MDRARYPSLQGKSVFITGGATGIGASLVRAFAEQGCHLAFVDIATEAGERLVAEMRASYSQPIVFLPCDVTDIRTLRNAITNAAAECGEFSVLINNVANDQRFDAGEMSTDDWRTSMAVNLDPAFFAAQAVYPMMCNQGGGSIINFSSINAIFGPERMPSYNTAKAGLLGLTKSLARDWGPDRIRVNAILPGWIETDMTADAIGNEKFANNVLPRIPMRRWGEGSDFGGIAVYLASDASSCATGTNPLIDGGYTSW
jgi:NAD(P)-dependent dehydrogenase (short-subunit alcohol dehydrogenase family)